MASHISAADAEPNFAKLLKPVDEGREEFIIERDGKPVGRLVTATPGCTMAEFVELLRTAPKPDPEYWDDLAEIIRNQPPMPPDPRER